MSNAMAWLVDALDLASLHPGPEGAAKERRRISFCHPACSSSNPTLPETRSRPVSPILRVLEAPSATAQELGYWSRDMKSEYSDCCLQQSNRVAACKVQPGAADL